MTDQDEERRSQGLEANEAGIKALTVENWLTPDIPSSIWVRMTRDGTMRRVTSKEWAQDFLAPRLADGVPDEVRSMFAVAQGALLYAYFYYPLYALGEDQLYRVAEAAVKAKCRLLGSTKRRRFGEAIDWLAEEGILTEDEKARWHSFRELRNVTTHSESQRLGPPGQALGTMRRLAERISLLFTGATGKVSQTPT